MSHLIGHSQHGFKNKRCLLNFFAQIIYTYVADNNKAVQIVPIIIIIIIIIIIKKGWQCTAGHESDLQPTSLKTPVLQYQPIEKKKGINPVLTWY